MKKVLIITYYWPPAGGPGVQRWLKFVKYLPDFGIEPIVYCPDNPNYPILDPSLVSDVSSDLTVLKTPINEPYKWAQLVSKSKTASLSKGLIANQKKQSILEKLLLFIRGNFFIPDARVSWVRPSLSFLSDYITEHQIDTIITTGPPHSLHLIGLQLKQKHKIKWLADFRDPWTQIGYHKKLNLSSSAHKKHKNLETSVLQTADEIVVTSQKTKSLFLDLTTKPILVLTNGYDFEITRDNTLDSKFTVSHIGSLLEGRNPSILWEVFSDLLKKFEDFAVAFQLNLIGSVSEEVMSAICSFGLESYVCNIGYIPHKDVLEYQKKSQVLLLIEENSKETEYIIPGKLFEYMASKRPIIAIGPAASDIEKILNQTRSGTYFRYDEKEVLRTLLLEHYETYKTQQLNVDSKGLEAYSRKSLTQELAQKLLK
ncbi:MAG: glycosyltransferase family 4 protein [Flavobacteriaceae bacterium]|nr:glycosyltransferase family 4 protein [Formosa sp.]MDG1375171.1 glycosyltransferase family 4 protein [Flavobacteriaceae bacterium]MDG2499567.1 glycosyltransferase family 4 protein [Flavobacteriaceae bacterium]